MEIATFAAGCFWGVEDAFMDAPGVVATRVGYTGGRTENPTYGDVCSHATGHAEAVEITFDPQLTTYDRLLDLFWECHDPTQLNRQGPDVGDQYRSAIFYHSEEQRQAAEAALERLDLSGRLRRRIVTEIVPATTFWEAEAYHQKYHQKQGGGCGF
ncbi:peptide-methionine (S)-S-oxide reductase MsrA [Oryzomonas japonica]|uniref:Peptide methionine sulfoxide reductase MsrA n=1 Tax=Oryzomonas japonica TaxID=2603858 RepID=A0A7J4ZRL7_9BACT|nr:peptide-methionine (S)-S-oxide reductase MsrA [Oryzomonas japonica]KAB0665774.1 peptide-methionine (S)-S-oxide reductase MsrA [Oryzomonas japonica]